MTGPFAERSSGVLLHVTSLPGPYGGGNLGRAAHDFAEFLARAGQRHWQMLPVVPPGGGNSPYDSPSAFAGSPWLVSLEALRRDGLLEPSDLVAPARLVNAPRTLFQATRRFRERRLRKACAAFLARPDGRRELERALEANHDWLPDYALFRALKRANGGKPWIEWPLELAQRRPAALANARRELSSELEYEVFVQREFSRQWAELRGRCHELGVKLLGDVPMFVAHDAADVWANQSLFQLHPDGQKRVVAGVPPDYFSADGQLWGNPIYDWQRMRETDYAWWIGRLRATLERFDAVRLDHFIGFHRYWEVPAGATSARDGHFVEAPGHELFERLRSKLGHLPFVAEDLGVMTEGVVRLRDDFGLPGMRVLAFAFGGDWREYQPHRFPRNVVAYTGTHDNDTMLGWLTSHAREREPHRAAALLAERRRALAYAASDGREAHWDMVRTLVASVANTTIFPLQDLLGLGSEARMNVPGVAAGNWTYRARPGELTPALAERLSRLCDTYERVPVESGARRNIMLGARGSSRFRRFAGLATLVTLSHVASAQTPSSAPPPPPDAAPAPSSSVAPAPHSDAPPAPAAFSEPPSPPSSPASPPANTLSPAPCDCDEHRGRESSRVRYELEGVVVRGNTRTNRRVVMRYVPFKPGDIIDVNDTAFQLLRFRLLGTGFFREVELSLEKGSRRGQVLLVIEVSERNTLVLNDLWMGLSKDAEVQGVSKGHARPLTAYAGVDGAETNLAGTGITLGGAAAFAQYELAVRARFLDPAFLGSNWMVAGTLLYTNAHDFFGNSHVIQAGSPAGEGAYEDYAIVAYKRFGGTLGLGRDLNVSTQVWLNYRLESLYAAYPKIASQVTGFDTEPIDFSIIRGKSVLSTVRATLQHDTRDQPFLPTQGWLVTLNGEFSLLPAALDYDYQKVEARASHWWRLPWARHVLSLDLYGGAIAGHAPFFEQFYVGDLSDFLPDRVLGMTFDRRPPPNFLGTQIVEERYGNYAFKLAAEYRIPLYRGQRSIYGIDLFGGGGVYGLASDRTLTDPPSAYSGLARVPIDLTATLGFRADTSVGGFTFSLSNALGFVFVGRGPAGGKPP